MSLLSRYTAQAVLVKNKKSRKAMKSHQASLHENGREREREILLINTCFKGEGLFDRVGLIERGFNRIITWLPSNHIIYCHVRKHLKLISRLKYQKLLNFPNQAGHSEIIRVLTKWKSYQYYLTLKKIRIICSLVFHQDQKYNLFFRSKPSYLDYCWRSMNSFNEASIQCCIRSYFSKSDRGLNFGRGTPK